MVRQELTMSCGAACARQLLLDAGIDVPEARLRELAGFDPDRGITLDALATALNELHPGVRYKYGTVWPENLSMLASVVPFIALLPPKPTRGQPPTRGATGAARRADDT